jgi:hypothetical protein
MNAGPRKVEHAPAKGERLKEGWNHIALAGRRRTGADSRLALNKQDGSHDAEKEAQQSQRV